MVRTRRRRTKIEQPKNRSNRRFYGLMWIWWGIILGGMLVKVEPESIKDFPFTDSYLLFYGVIFIWLWMGLAFLRNRLSYSLLWAIGGMGWLWMLSHALANWVNSLLLLGLLVIAESLLKKPKESDESRDHLIDNSRES